MRKKIILACFCGAMSLPKAHAEEGQDDLRAVHIREATVNQLTSALFNYELVVKDALHPDTGVEKQLQATTADVAAWIAVYQSLDGEIAKIPNLIDIEQKIALTIRDQALTLNKISGRLQALNALCDKSLATLSLVGRLASSAETDSVRSDLESRRLNLVNRINTVKEADFTLDQKLKEVQELLNYDYYYTKILNEAVRRGIDTNAPIVVDFANYLNAEIYASQYWGAFNDRITRHSIAMLNLEGVRSKALLDQLKSDHKAIVKGIESSKLVKDEKTRLVSEITSLLDKASKDLEKSILIYKPQVLAQSMQKAKVRKNRLICSKPNTGEHCQAYKKLKDLNPERILTYDDKGVAELEKLWLSVEE